MAVKVLGLVNVPGAGDQFEVLKNEKDAKKRSEILQEEDRTSLHGANAPKITLDDLFNDNGANNDKKELRL